MKKLFAYLFLLTPLITFAGIDTNPADTVAAPAGKTRYFVFGLDAGNNFSYMNRTDQSTYPYLNPSFLYKAKSGFYVMTGAYSVANVKTDYGINPWVELDLGTGWKYKIDDNNRIGFGYSYSAYDRNFPLLASALSNNIIANYAHNFSWLDARASFDYSFGKLGGDSVLSTKTTTNAKGKVKKKVVEKATFFSSHDVFLNLNISHSFDWDDVVTKDDEISFDPGVTMSLGTNNFYNNYYKRTLLSKKLKRKVSQTEADTTTSASDAGAATFMVREYILDFPLSYTYGRFDFTADFSYIIPVNQPTDPDFKVNPYSLFKLSLAYMISKK